MELLFAADLVPTKRNQKLFEEGNITELFGEEIIKVINKADFWGFNLEVPLTDVHCPIKKNGPCLIASTSAINGIAKLNPSIVFMANNHVLDQSESGLLETCDLLKQKGIPYIGVGDNLNSACEPYIFEKDGLFVGIYNCTEHEFSVAADDKPGANPFDPLYSLSHIAELKKKCDRVIVIYHGGKEQYRYPSPMLQKVCRRIVEEGADVVLCQHSHCIGCKEEYKEGTIVYGQGNFIFDDLDNEFWSTSLLVRVIIDKEDIQVDYLPIEKSNECVRLSNEEQSNEILKAFNTRSDEIIKKGVVEKHYEEFADKHYTGYVSTMLGKKWYFRALNKLTSGRWYKKYYSRGVILGILNYLECEAHRELLIQALKTRVDSEK